MKKILPPLLTALCAVVVIVSGAMAAGFFTAQDHLLLRLDAPQERQPILQAEKAETSININSASIEELMSLPGIGLVTAQAIIDAREKSPFYFEEDIKIVPGIGEKRFAQISSLIRVED